MEKRIIVALDGMTREGSLELAALLAPDVWGFKVNDLLLQCGVSIIGELKKYGRVFADPKLHDIPNTVANSIRRLAAEGADLITVHASGGRAMLEAAANVSGSSQILGITVLTSHDHETAEGLYRQKLDEVVLSLAELAADSGLHGVVCSPSDLGLLAENMKCQGLIKVTPGVRPEWYEAADDQSRTTTPREAVLGGASLLVIGRPITAAEDPQAAIGRIVEEMA